MSLEASMRGGLGRVARGRASQVPAVTLDKVAGAATFVRIDVEDADLEVLAGARRLLSEQRPMVLLEVHADRPPGGRGGSTAAVRRVLDGHRYDIEVASRIDRPERVEHWLALPR